MQPSIAHANGQLY